MIPFIKLTVLRRSMQRVSGASAKAAQLSYWCWSDGRWRNVNNDVKDLASPTFELLTQGTCVNSLGFLGTYLLANVYTLSRR